MPCVCLVGFRFHGERERRLGRGSATRARRDGGRLRRRGDDDPQVPRCGTRACMLVAAVGDAGDAGETATARRLR